MSWLDLWAFIKYSRVVLGINSATGHVMENPPVDPATVPTQETLASIRERRAAKLAQLQGADTQVVAHNRRDRKRAASS